MSAELTSGDDLIVYVENSAFFTEEQKNVIEFEVDSMDCRKHYIF